MTSKSLTIAAFASVLGVLIWAVGWGPAARYVRWDAAVKYAVSDVLLNPDTPRFDLPAWDGGLYYCGWVNGRNAFGAYVGETPFQVLMPVSWPYVDAPIVLDVGGDEVANQLVYAACAEHGYMETIAELTAPAPKLQVRQEASPISDWINVTLTVRAEESVERYGETITPTLVIRCAENVTNWYINWGEFVGSDRTPVLLRYDGAPAKWENMTISTNYEATGVWTGSVAIPMIKRMIKTNQLVAAVTPRGENRRLATFDISGVRNVIEPLRSACHW